jgi:hypothetical protein
MSELAQGLEDDGEELGSVGSAEAHSTSSPSPPVRETRYSTRGGSGASTTAPARDSPPERDDDDSLAIGRRRKKAKLTMKPLTEAQRVERRCVPFCVYVGVCDRLPAHAVHDVICCMHCV